MNNNNPNSHDNNPSQEEITEYNNSYSEPGAEKSPLGTLVKGAGIGGLAVLTGLGIGELAAKQQSKSVSDVDTNPSSPQKELDKLGVEYPKGNDMGGVNPETGEKRIWTVQENQQRDESNSGNDIEDNTETEVPAEQEYTPAYIDYSKETVEHSLHKGDSLEDIAYGYVDGYADIKESYPDKAKQILKDIEQSLYGLTEEGLIRFDCKAKLPLRAVIIDQDNPNLGRDAELPAGPEETLDK